jgi:sulfur-oxidizing protein SoxZ
MAAKIRIKAASASGETEVLVRIDHPMENGLRVDPKTKARIPPHFIQKVTFAINGEEIAVADLGPAVSKDPLIKVKIRGAKPGDKIKVSWSDNKGVAGEKEAVIA